MQRLPNGRLAAPPPAADPRGVSTLAVLALAFGAAGFGFGAYFYLVPYQNRSVQVIRLTRELQQASARPVAPRSPADQQAEQARAQMKALQADVEEKLGPAGATVTAGPHRLQVRFPEDRLFDARGPYLTKPGQETLQALGGVLAARAQRVVIVAPMGGATVPRWIRAELPTPADLSAARAGTALKTLVKGGVRAPTVFAVIGSLANDDPNAPATLDVEIEP